VTRTEEAQATPRSLRSWLMKVFARSTRLTWRRTRARNRREVRSNVPPSARTARRE
jgi:hypothetical protein